MEDIIEEIFGEIIDEFDELDLLEDKVDDNSFNFSARLEIDYLNSKYDLNIPEGEYDILGGLILNYTREIPKKMKKLILIILQLKFYQLTITGLIMYFSERIKIINN